MPKPEVATHTEAPLTPETLTGFCQEIAELHHILIHLETGRSNTHLIPPLYNQMCGLLNALPDFNPKIANALLNFDPNSKLTADQMPGVIQLETTKNTCLGSYYSRLRIWAKPKQKPEQSSLSITCQTNTAPSSDLLNADIDARDGSKDYIDVSINPQQKGQVLVYRSTITNESSSLGTAFLQVERNENPQDKEMVTKLFKSLFSNYLVDGSLKQLPQFSLIKVHLPNQEAPVFIATASPDLVKSLEFSHTSARLFIKNNGEFKDKSVLTIANFKGDLIDGLWQTDSSGKTESCGDILLKDPDDYIVRINSFISDLLVHESPTDYQVIMFDFQGIDSPYLTGPVSVINVTC